MAKNKTAFFAAALAVLILAAVVGLRAKEMAVPPAEEALPTPAPSAAAEPPHVHRYDPLDGRCRDCGAICDHGGGLREGQCVDCGWHCDHARHDGESLLCLVCGELCCHHFTMAGRCEGCGREAPLAAAELPDRFFEPSEHEGRCLSETLTAPDGTELPIALWLPYNGEEAGPCNVVILLHGDGGSCEDWVSRELPTRRGNVQLCRVYDRIAQERLCAPFLVVSISTRGMEDPEYGEKLIAETLLPYLARSYPTWMTGDSREEIAAAREHIAIGGLSRGSMYAYSVGMGRCLDVAANFCCFSNGYEPGLVQRLTAEPYASLPIQSYVATVGLRDEPDYVRPHRQHYALLCEGVPQLRDGVNARMLEIDEGHNFLMWSASIYDALLLMF